ncbi:MAG: transcription elongation GreA/GreB family factor, partial [Haloarculaceae archaeon]
MHQGRRGFLELLGATGMAALAGCGSPVESEGEQATSADGEPERTQTTATERADVSQEERWSASELVPADKGTKSQFGESVAVSADGSTAIVGDWAADDAEGTAYVFERD